MHRMRLELVLTPHQDLIEASEFASVAPGDPTEDGEVPATTHVDLASSSII